MWYLFGAKQCQVIKLSVNIYVCLIKRKSWNFHYHGHFISAKIPGKPLLNLETLTHQKISRINPISNYCSAHFSVYSMYLCWLNTNWSNDLILKLKYNGHEVQSQGFIKKIVQRGSNWRNLDFKGATMVKDMTKFHKCHLGLSGVCLNLSVCVCAGLHTGFWVLGGGGGGGGLQSHCWRGRGA